MVLKLGRHSSIHKAFNFCSAIETFYCVSILLKIFERAFEIIHNETFKDTDRSIAM